MSDTAVYTKTLLHEGTLGREMLGKLNIGPTKTLRGPKLPSCTDITTGAWKRSFIDTSQFTAEQTVQYVQYDIIQCTT